MTSEIFENRNRTPIEESIFEYLEEKGVAKESDVERRFAEETRFDLSRIREGLEGLEERGDVYALDQGEDTLYSSSLGRLNERGVYNEGNIEDYLAWEEEFDR